MTKRLLLLLGLLPLALAACKKETVCPAGEVACGGVCVSLLDDAANCGACGNACSALGACVSGHCGCAPGASACGDACVDLQSDAAHCGACDGAACSGADVCSAGACASQCATGLTGCGPGERDCVDLAADRFNCGACGNVCAPGAACREGACRADLQVACFATNEVRAVTADLEKAGPTRAAGAGPISLAIDGGRVFAANSLSHSLSAFPLDPRLPGVERLVDGNDFEAVVAHESLLFVANSGLGTLIVWDPLLERVVDEIPLGTTADVNPRGVVFVGARAYVPLYGQDETAGGQSIAVVDVSGLATCAQVEAAPPACGAGGTCADGRTCRGGKCVRRCGKLVKTIDLRAMPAAFDAPGLPFPARAVAVDGKVYVTLANMKKATTGPFAGYYVEPSGPARLAVVDTTAGDAISFVSLGACQDAGAIASDGARLWISCADAAAPGLMPVSLGGGVPAPGQLTSVPVGAPGNLAFCNGMGYLTDLWSGSVVRFDPEGVAVPLSAEVCPLTAGDFPWAWAADVACGQ